MFCHAVFHSDGMTTYHKTWKIWKVREFNEGQLIEVESGERDKSGKVSE